MIVPLISSSEYTMRITLDGVVCNLRFYWSEFSDTIKPDMDTIGCWFMDLSSDGIDIKAIKLVTGAELMWPYSLDGFGGFYLYDLSGDNEDPEFSGLGDRWELNYIPESELLAFREALRLETV